MDTNILDKIYDSMELNPEQRDDIDSILGDMTGSLEEQIDLMYELSEEYKKFSSFDDFKKYMESSEDLIFNLPVFDDSRVNYEIYKETSRNKIKIQPVVGIKCPRCGSNRIISMPRQTRASDEAISFLLSCLVCAHRWQQ